MSRIGAAALAILVALAGPAAAQSIRSIYRSAPTLVGLPGLANERYQNAADVILEQAIRNLPLFPAASSAYTYRWNADRDELERVDDSVSPFFLTERGQSLGEGLLNVGVTFGYYKVNCANGCRLGVEQAPVSVCCGSKIRYQARTDLTYTVSTFNFTYGVTDDLDVNIAVPIATLDMGLDVTRQDTPSSPIRRASLLQSAANVSDMMVRAKYKLFDTSGPLGAAQGAAGLRVRIPSGNPREGLGTGYGEIGPYFAVSTNMLDGWLDSYLTAVSTPASATRAGARRTTPGRSTCTRRAATTGGRASPSPGASSGAASSPACAPTRRSRAPTSRRTASSSCRTCAPMRAATTT
jgi:hypothetical protein